MTTDLQALIQHLRGGDWNLRAPQEMADMIADKLEVALAAAAVAVEPVPTENGRRVEIEQIARMIVRAAAECRAGTITFQERDERVAKLVDALATPHPSPSAAERWIPVSERLPEPDVQCLVLWRAGDEYLPAIASRCVRWKRMLLWHGHAGSHNDVTHWMPLLAAPAAPSASPAEAPADQSPDDKRAALEKARAAGLSEDEIKALGFGGPR